LLIPLDDRAAPHAKFPADLGRYWRFGATDYEAALRTAASLGHSLNGKPVEASWDAALTAAMQQHRISVAEGALAALLLEDIESAC
jgi:hypothetical protein